MNTRKIRVGPWHRDHKSVAEGDPPHDLPRDPKAMLGTFTHDNRAMRMTIWADSAGTVPVVVIDHDGCWALVVQPAELVPPASTGRSLTASERHGVGMVDKWGVACLCEAGFLFGDDGWVAFNANMRAALAPPPPGARRIVYIAHALRGDWDFNIEDARTWAVLALRAGYAPVAPYLELGGRLDDQDPADRALGLEHDMAMIPRCDEVWLCGATVSAGMQLERDLALGRGIPIRRYVLYREIPLA